MSGGGVDPGVLEPNDSVARYQEVEESISLQMPALQQHRLGAERPARADGIFPVGDGPDAPACERFGLRKVRRHHGRAADQPPEERFGGVPGQESMPPFRAHDRVDHSRHAGRAALQDVIAEPARTPLIPELPAIRQALMQEGIGHVGISGAGPTLFAVCTTAAQAEFAANYLRTHYEKNADGMTQICQLSHQGARVLSSSSDDAEVSNQLNEFQE